MKDRGCLIGGLIVVFSLCFLFGLPLANAQDEEANLISVENGGMLIESAGDLPDWPDEDWNGANDDELETWSGTVTVFNAPAGEDHPWAIFAFENEAVLSINSVSFFMLSKADRDENLQTRAGKDFQVLVSTKGTGEADFDVVLEDIVEIDINLPFDDQEWVSFTFDAVKAKYVKLILLSNYGDGTYTTLGEFAVHGGLAAINAYDKALTTWAKLKIDL